jgi:hypothetical protein
LLISVFSDATPEQKKQNANSYTLSSDFEIEVIQTETTLELGETKNGYIVYKNYENYVVSPANALVSIRNME